MRWSFPDDYKLLTSSSKVQDFIGMECTELRPENILQNGKFFCWKKSVMEQPLKIVDKPTSDKKCIRLTETADLPYKTKYLCHNSAEHEITLKWNYVDLPFYEKSDCIGFDVWRNKFDVWSNNFLCHTQNSTSVKFESKICQAM